MIDYPQVALAFMNHDHAEFAALRDQLLALRAVPDAAKINALLDTLAAHTRTHFAEEERHMLDYGFPPYPMHKGEHERVLADMAARIDRWRSDGDAAALFAWLDADVGRWFVEHIQTMDYVTAGFVQAQMQAED